jgi:biopolymer transport protein ExbD
MRKPRRRHETGGGEGLMLAAMVDMMVNLLIFLLHLYGSGGVEVPPGLQLASSTSTAPTSPAVSVAVSPDAVSLRGKVLLRGTGNDADPWQASSDGTIPVLQDALEAEAKRIEADARPAADGAVPEPEILVQVDRRVPWTALQPVLRSAGRAGFVKVRFLVTSVGEHGG